MNHQESQESRSADQSDIKGPESDKKGGGPPLMTPAPPQHPQRAVVPPLWRHVPPQRWVVHNVGNAAFWTFVPLVYCTTHLEDAYGTLHFKSGFEASLASTLDRYFLS
eukprot:1195568-Prorocentrum_minimum.AAC.1